MLKAKLTKKNGFTLVEMLIVVAIIAILVAISIPLVSTSLDKAKKATDAANLRAAKACAVIEYLGNDKSVKDQWYDIESGTMKTNTPTEGYGETTENEDKAIKVIKADETGIEVAWTEIS